MEVKEGNTFKMENEGRSARENQTNEQRVSAEGGKESQMVEGNKDEMEHENTKDGTCRIEAEFSDDSEEPQTERECKEVTTTELEDAAMLPTADNDGSQTDAATQGEAVKPDHTERLPGTNKVDPEQETKGPQTRIQVSETNQIDISSTMSRIRNILMSAKSAHGEDDSIEVFEAEHTEIPRGEDKEEMKRITEYIDELQKDVKIEMEAIGSSLDESESETRLVEEYPPAGEGNEDDIVAWFAPFHCQLDEALDDFHATAAKARGHDGACPKSLTEATETVVDEEDVDDDSSAPLSISEALEMVMSAEDMLEMCASPVRHVHCEMKPDNTNGIVDAAVPSDLAANDDVSTKELAPETTSATGVEIRTESHYGRRTFDIPKDMPKIGAFPLCDAHRTGKLKSDNANDIVDNAVHSDLTANDEVSSKGLTHEMTAGAVEEMQAYSHDDMRSFDFPSSTESGAGVEVKAADSEVAADGQVSSDDDDADDDNDRIDFSFASSSDVDEDEDDVNGSFPVVQTSSNVNDVDEIKDVPVIEDERRCVDCLCSTQSMVGVLEEGHDSFVHAHVKHIASGSFRTDTDESNIIPNSSNGADEFEAMVKIEVDELQNMPSSCAMSEKDEDKKKASLLLQILNASVLVTVGFLVRTFRPSKKKARI